MLFDWLVVGRVVPTNPAHSVHGQKHVVKRGKTPILTRKETRELLDSIDTDMIQDLHDRALIGALVYSFTRIGAPITLKVDDYFAEGKRWKLRLHVKGGKEHVVPVHHTLEEYLDAYIGAACIRDQAAGPHFRTLATTEGRPLPLKPMGQADAWRMIRRRPRAADIPTKIGCHTSRATGFTAYLENDGTLEHAQQIAAHESPRTTSSTIERPTRSALTRSGGLRSDPVRPLTECGSLFRVQASIRFVVREARRYVPMTSNEAVTEFLKRIPFEYPKHMLCYFASNAANARQR